MICDISIDIISSVYHIPFELYLEFNTGVTLAADVVNIERLPAACLAASASTQNPCRIRPPRCSPGRDSTNGGTVDIVEQSAENFKYKQNSSFATLI